MKTVQKCTGRCAICFGSNQTTSTTTKTPSPWVTAAGKSNLNYATNYENQNFTPYSAPMVAGFSPQQTASFGLGTDVASGAAPAIGNTGNWINDYANSGAGSVTPSTIASRMSPYMNRYVMQALAPQVEAQDQQFAGQNKSFDSSSTGAGAFGDSSYNLGRTNLTNQQNIGRTGLVADAYQRAFNTAIGAGAQDVSNDINAQTTNANLKEQQLGREATGANAAFGMGVGSTNLNNNLGGQQTAADQARLNAQYNEFLRQQYQDPAAKASIANSAINTAANASPTTTTNTAPNNAGYGLIGAGLGAVGTALGGPIGGMVGAGLGGAVGSMFGGGGQGGAGASGVSMYGPGSNYGMAPYGPGYADGGPTAPGPIMVGERGREIFVPHAQDIVVPSDVMAAARAKRAEKTGEGIPAYADGGMVPPPGAPRMPAGLPLSFGSGSLGQGMVNSGMAPPPNGSAPPSSPTLPGLPPSYGSAPGAPTAAPNMPTFGFGHEGMMTPPAGGPGAPPTMPQPGQVGLGQFMSSGIFGHPTSGAGGFNPFGGQPGPHGKPVPHGGRFGTPQPDRGFLGFADGGYVGNEDEEYRPEEQEQPYEVGQNGPEVIAPQTDGVVIPNEVIEAQREKEQSLANGAGQPEAPSSNGQEFKPPLFLQSGVAAPGQPPQAPQPAPPPRSPMRGTMALGNPQGYSAAKERAESIERIKENPIKAAMNVGSLAAPGAGQILISAAENATAGQHPHGMPLNSPRKQPKSDAVSYPHISTVFDALNPVRSANAADANDPMPVEVIPDPTQKEATEITRINGKIEVQKPKLEKAIRSSQFRDPTRDPAVIAAQSAMHGLQSELDRVEGPNSELGKRRAAANADFRDAKKAWQGRQDALASRTVEASLPYAVRNKDQMDWNRDVMPKISAGTGAVMGLMRGNPLWKMAKAAGAGAFEGGATAAWPTFQDAEFLPPGGNWRDATSRIFNGDEQSKDFWKRVGAGAASHATIAAGTAGTTALGREAAGELAHGAGRAATKARDWWRERTAERPPQSAPPSTPPGTPPSVPPVSSAPSAVGPRVAAAAPVQSNASVQAVSPKTKVEPTVLKTPEGHEFRIFDYGPGKKQRWTLGGNRISEEEAMKLHERLRALPNVQPGAPARLPTGAAGSAKRRPTEPEQPAQ